MRLSWIAGLDKWYKENCPCLFNTSKLAALFASNNDPIFKAYYQKKRSEGKHHLTSVGAVARKLCYTIHAILKNNTPYLVHHP